MPDFTDFNAVLLWLAAAGAPYVTGKILALVAENVPGWHTLPAKVKAFLPLLLSVLLSLGASLLLKETAVVAALSPTWAAVAAAALMYLGSQQAYLDVKKTSLGGYGIRPASGPFTIEEQYEETDPR